MYNEQQNSHNTIIRSKIGKSGKVIIPALIRKQLNLSEGSNITFQVQNNTLCISTPQIALKALQEQLKIIDTDISPVDILIEERRREAKNEQ